MFPNRRYAYLRLNKKEDYLRSLSGDDQRLLSKYRKHLESVRSCIDCNQAVIREILRDRVLYPTGDGNSEMDTDNEEAPPHVRHGDMDQVSIYCVYVRVFVCGFSSDVLTVKCLCTVGEKSTNAHAVA